MVRAGGLQRDKNEALRRPEEAFCALGRHPAVWVGDTGKVVLRGSELAADRDEKTLHTADLGKLQGEVDSAGIA